jgi:hypothetical protein
MANVKENFRYLRTDYNPDYESGLKDIPLRSCLIRNNSENFNPEILRVKTKPKWITTLTHDNIDTETGEVTPSGYATDDFKRANHNKIKALDAFCDHFQPLYKKRKVSLMFHTFTQANQANLQFSDMLDNVRYHYEQQMNRPLRGYIWTLEVSEGMHMHYHLCVAINRVSFSSIPDALKFESLWGRRTGVEFVKKNVRHYMAKYFAKHNSRVIGYRSYGKSRTFE